MRHGMNALALVALLAWYPTQNTYAAVIERDLYYTLGPISGTFGAGQGLSGVGTFFADDPFVFGVGDTLILNILFDSRLEVSDLGAPTDEYFSFALNTFPGSPGFNGTWTSSIEAVGAEGDVWAGAITFGWIGGGGGFGWGGQGINVTSSQGSFTGIRWTTTITSANEGSPMTLYAFTGVQMGADGIRILPAPDILLQQLLDDVTGVGPGKSLANKVKLAQTYYTAGDIPATCAVLTDFVSTVSGYAAGKKPKLSPEVASQLTTDAQAIMTAIGCN